MADIRILIVDDEKVIRDGVERALAGVGYVVAKADSGERGSMPISLRIMQPAIELMRTTEV